MSLTVYQLQYQITPIWLENGIAGSAGSMLPVLALINPEAFGETLLNGNPDFNFSDAFGIFQPVVGGSLVEQQIATSPFANLNVAANAIIRNPINLSMIMMTPMTQEGAWEVKLNTMTALKASLDAHNNSGGTYTIMTPAYTYTHMCMVSLTDVSTAQSPIPQNTWRWDFTRPLVTLEQAQAAMNNLMNQITAGVPTGTTTGVGTTAGGSGGIGSDAVAGGTAATTGATTVIGQPANPANMGSGAGGTPAGISSIPLGGGPGNNSEVPTGTPLDPLGWSVAPGGASD